MKGKQQRDGRGGGAPGSGAPGRGGRDGQPGQGREGRGRPRNDRDRDDRKELDERVIDITRVSKVIKGGRRFAFRTVVVVGDGEGKVNIGIGKARAVPDSIRKGTDRARRRLEQMQKVSLAGTTIPHPITAEWGGAKILMKPAMPGTGVIAGGAMRAVLEAVGIRDILCKSQGSSNLLNVAMATLIALQELRSPEDIARRRGISPEALRPAWERRPVEVVTPIEQRATEAVAPAAKAEDAPGERKSRRRRDEQSGE